MGRQLRSSDFAIDLEMILQQGIALAENGKLHLTAAYLALAQDALAADTARQRGMPRTPNKTSVDALPPVAPSLGQAD